jgi:hypothetical protein
VNASSRRNMLMLGALPRGRCSYAAATERSFPTTAAPTRAARPVSGGTRIGAGHGRGLPGQGGSSWRARATGNPNQLEARAARVSPRRAPRRCTGKARPVPPRCLPVECKRAPRTCHCHRSTVPCRAVPRSLCRSGPSPGRPRCFPGDDGEPSPRALARSCRCESRG